MCGILGAITKNKTELELFRNALQTLSHRGPDSEGVKEFSDKKCAVIFGQKRLAIIDLHPSANQPMSDHTGKYWITFNGEIYNYLELKEILIKKGHKFRTKSDTEVILEGYKEYGIEIVKKLRGMFAFGLFDKNKNLIFIARDHFGKKPLYYFLGKDTLIFGSEVKALVAFVKNKKTLTIDHQAVVKFLMYGYIPSPNSIYNEIKKLPAATVFEISLKPVSITKRARFWKPENITLNNIPLSDAMEKTDELFRDAVKRRLIADVPVGSFLSGGIDSSLVTTIASEFHPGIETFSVVYADKEFDESKYVKIVGDNLSIKYNMLNFKDSYASSLLKEVLSFMDEPMADASLLPTTFIAKQTRKKVTVALSGDGGDELFGGYPKYNAQQLFNNQLLFNILRVGNSKIIDYLPINPSKKNIVKKLLSGTTMESYSRHFVWGSGGFTFVELQKLVKRSFLENEEKVFSESKLFFETFKQADEGNRVLFLDVMIQLPDWYLVKADRGSMSQSLEVRSPFLDVDLAEFVMTLPSKYKYSINKNKILLKKIANKYLPKAVIDRKKMGFGLPLNKWLTTNFKEEVEDSLAALPEDIFDRNYVLSLWEGLLSGKEDNGTRIWRLFILGSFIKNHVS
ncbi:MAG: asparagine synthase (glutamine-hydrolyzing) [Candidatus Levybacteria bacterium]|nr:asparagine synthase (glutamine-hydrolyzing) [Candidatus Levybacteria bacterium]